MSFISAGGAVVGAGEVQYQIERSLRFNSADSAYLNRTPASAGNRQKFTISAWVKRGKLGAANGIYGSGTNGNNEDRFAFAGGGSANKLTFDSYTGGATNLILMTTQVFRDVSAWYHVVLAVDTTQATSSNRVLMYVNGVQITAFDTSTYPALNANLNTNNNSAQYVGTNPDNQYFDGYMTEMHFVDGQALDPTDFGEFSTDTGVWEPKRYIGEYGTNGFYLNFSDNSTTDALGTDFSGNGNTWDDNGFSVTAGAGNDSLVDVPTLFGTDTGVGGEVRGNYATLNPLDNRGCDLVNGNLQATIAENENVAATFAPTSGKWYWETTLTDHTNPYIGISATNSNASGFSANAVANNNGGDIYFNGSQTAFQGSQPWSENDIVGVALDVDAQLLWWSVNGQWYTADAGSESEITAADVAAGNNGYDYSAQLTNVKPFFGSSTSNAILVINFGQRAFEYTAPSGFKALVTTNLPDPTVIEGDEYFNTVLYTGDGLDNRAITGVGFQPDWLWVKSRSAAQAHRLYDAVRGSNLALVSNSTGAEFDSSADELQSFDTDGFTIDDAINVSSRTYVAWNWKANGAGVSNTAGTISSTVSANTDAGFSIVTYTGTGAAATVGHGLGAVLGMYIVKNRDAADAWQVYHAANTANPETDYLVLNTTAATADAADRWNDTLPTSTVFSIGDGVEVNTNTEDYVAYCFAAIPGYSAFGSYTGNGSADGPFVFLGFRPAWVMLKKTSATDDWVIFDTARNTFNVVNNWLFPNLSNAELTATGSPDVLSNGFKLRSTSGATNASGASFIFMAFAENPFKFALAR